MPYSTEQELIDYATNRGIVLTGNPATLLVNANDYIETQNYKGLKAVTTQATTWPRDGVVIDGLLISALDIPAGIKKAELQVAIYLDQGFDPYAVVEQAVKREKVDVLEVEYQDNSNSVIVLRKVNALLSPYLASAGGFNSVRA